MLSIAMLLFFVMGQVNLAWATHYCGDQLISSEVSLAPEKSDCCGDESTANMDCCEDEVTVADADDFFGKSDIQIDLSPDFAIAFVVTFFNLELPFSTQEWDREAPENLPQLDLTILYQTFLI